MIAHDRGGALSDSEWMDERSPCRTTTCSPTRVAPRPSSYHLLRAEVTPSSPASGAPQ